MDLKELALALGLPADSKQEKVFSSVAALVAGGTEAKKSLETLSAELGTHGLKLEAGKLVKLEGVKGDLDPKDGDSPETLELKKLLAENKLETAKTRLSTAKDLAAKYVGEGRVPPAVKEELEKLFSLAGKAEALSLSQDGQAVTKVAFDGLESLKKVLNAVTPLHGKHLTQLGPVGDEEKKQREALSAKGKEVAQRVQPGKKK